jgi:2-dehydro-3-deoxyphosphogluconate aldolase / (4S)-4-hydroxy-2-oxoglutarate aldolase
MIPTNQTEERRHEVGHSRQEVVQTLLETGVVAVVRVDQPAELTGLASALVKGGVRMVEMTMTVPGALQAIEATVREFGEEALIGAGTVLDATTARLAISAGAAFVVGPTFNPEVIAISHLYGVAVIPGCLTPTEIVGAWSAGADVIKLFPGRVATPGYFSDLKGPFPSIKLMPTGNVDRKTAPEYIRAGAVAVGVGKALVDPAALQSGDWEVITQNARDFRTLVDDARRFVR